MGKNLKVFLGLLLIVLTTSFCSSKKSGNNAGLALVALAGGGSSSSSSSSSSSPKTAIVDLAKAFSGISDVMAVKSTVALAEKNVASPSLKANAWTRLASAGKVKISTDQTLEFAIVPSGNGDIGTNVIKIGSYKGTGKTDTIGFGLKGLTLEKKDNDSFTKDGITTIALLVKRNTTTANFTTIKDNASSVLVAAGVDAAITAMNAATGIKDLASKPSKTDITNAATAAGGAQGTDGGSQKSYAAPTITMTGANGIVTVKLTNAKFKTASFTKESIISDFNITGSTITSAFATQNISDSVLPAYNPVNNGTSTIYVNRVSPTEVTIKLSALMKGGANSGTVTVAANASISVYVKHAAIQTLTADGSGYDTATETAIFGIADGSNTGNASKSVYLYADKDKKHHLTTPVTTPPAGEEIYRFPGN